MNRPRKKPGPKTEVLTEQRLERVALTLDPLTRTMLRVVGDGNESKGVRHAARVAYDKYQKG